MDPFSALIATIFLPVISMPLLVWISRYIGHRVGWLALALPIIGIINIFNIWKKNTSNLPLIVEKEWIPQLNINLSFLIDGTSLFFGFVVLIMGALVTLYATQYLHERKYENGKFYAYLMLFMAAMTGTVFSNNIYLLFIFWELTSIASFLLIGYYFYEKKSREGALMALLVTGLTGLVLLVGIILLNIITGSTSIATINTATSHALLLPALGCLLIGAFGKSAQFPFHFWLPNAMAAPTPVSAYLHSAAMVKLGVFLVARFFPLLQSETSILNTLILFGFITMTIGAIFSVLSNDIKALLAYTTVSQLGFLMGMYGLSGNGAEHDFFHILNHVFYKGSLFMIAGIIIHTVHKKDIREIGGLFKLMPLTGIACFIAVAGMAAIPGTTGFISKELMLELILHHGHFTPLLIGVLGLSAICLFISGARLAFHAFIKKSELDITHYHKPSLLFQIPPLLLSLCVLTFGLFPSILEKKLATFFVTIQHQPNPSHLAIWHGLNTPLIISLSLIAIGIIGYQIANKLDWKFTTIPPLLKFDSGFKWGLIQLDRLATIITVTTRTYKPTSYLKIISSGIVILILYSLSKVPYETFLKVMTVDTITPIAAITITLIGISSIAVLWIKPWIGRLIALSVTGFLVSFYFMIFKAPDIALTQLLIESISLILFLLLLAKFPKQSEYQEQTLNRFSIRKLDTLSLSIVFGTCMSIILLLFVKFPATEKAGKYFIENTISLAEGHNAVNTILVDFRGFDTMGEISVLVIALLGVIGLLSKQKKAHS